MKCYEDGYGEGTYKLDDEEVVARKDIWNIMRCLGVDHAEVCEREALGVFNSAWQRLAIKREETWKLCEQEALGVFNSAWQRLAVNREDTRKCPPLHQALRIIASVVETGFASVIDDESSPMVELASDEGGDAKRLSLFDFVDFLRGLMRDLKTKDQRSGGGKGKEDAAEDHAHMERARAMESAIEDRLAQYDVSADAAGGRAMSLSAKKLGADARKYMEEFRETVSNIDLYGEAMQAMQGTQPKPTLETRRLREVQPMLQAPCALLPEFDAPTSMLMHGPDNRDPSNKTRIQGCYEFGRNFCKTFMENHGVGTANALVVHVVTRTETDAAVVEGRAKASDSSLISRIEAYACCDLGSGLGDNYNDFAKTVDEAKDLLRRPTTARTWEIIDGSHRANYLHLFFLNLVPWFFPSVGEQHFYKDMQSTAHLRPLLDKLLDMQVSFNVYGDTLPHDLVVRYTLASMQSTVSTESDVAYVKRACTAFGSAVADLVEDRTLVNIFGSMERATAVFAEYKKSTLSRGDRYTVVWTMLLMVNMNTRMLRELAKNRTPIGQRGASKGQEYEKKYSAYGGGGFSCTLPSHDLLARDLGLYGTPGEALDMTEQKFLDDFVVDASSTLTVTGFLELGVRRIQRALEIHVALQKVNKSGAVAGEAGRGSQKKSRTTMTSHFALSRAIALVALCGNTYDEPEPTASVVMFFKLALDVEDLKYLKISGSSKLTSVAGGHIHALYNRWKESKSGRGRFSLQEQFDSVVKSAAPTRPVPKRRRRAASSSEDIGSSSSDDDESGEGAADKRTKTSGSMGGVPAAQVSRPHDQSTMAGKSHSKMAGKSDSQMARVAGWQKRDSRSNSDGSVGESNSDRSCDESNSESDDDE